MINPFKTKNAIIVRNDCLYKIKSSFFRDIEVTRINLPNIRGQPSYVKVADESSNVKLIGDNELDNEENEDIYGFGRDTITPAKIKYINKKETTKYLYNGDFISITLYPPHICALKNEIGFDSKNQRRIVIKCRNKSTIKKVPSKNKIRGFNGNTK